MKTSICKYNSRKNSLKNNKKSKINIKYARKNKNIKINKMKGGTFENDLLRLITDSTFTEFLYFNKITDNDLLKLTKALQNNTSLTKFSLFNSDFIDDNKIISLVSALKNNNTLIELVIPQNNIGPNGAIYLAEALQQDKTFTTFTALKILDIGQNNIQDEGAKALAEALKTNRTLTSLNIFINNIGVEGASAIAEALQQNTTLTSLNIGQNNIQGEGAIALAEALKTNESLTTLDIYGNEIGPDGASAIAEALKTNTKLTTLYIYSNNIQDKGAEALAEALQNNKTLTTLKIGYNKIGPKGAKALAKALLENKTLTTLNIGNNNFSDAGKTHLTEALKTNTTLTNLNIDGNDFSVKNLLNLLNNNHTITNLNIGSNNIKGEGAIALAEALQNTKLTKLIINNNKFGPEGAKALANILKDNKILTELYIDNNNIQDEGAKALVEALKTNKSLKLLTLSQNKLTGTVMKELIKTITDNNKTLNAIYLHLNEGPTMSYYHKFDTHSNTKIASDSTTKIDLFFPKLSNKHTYNNNLLNPIVKPLSRITKINNKLVLDKQTILIVNVLSKSPQNYNKLMVDITDINPFVTPFVNPFVVPKKLTLSDLYNFVSIKKDENYKFDTKLKSLFSIDDANNINLALKNRLTEAKSKNPFQKYTDKDKVSILIEFLRKSVITYLRTLKKRNNTFVEINPFLNIPPQYNELDTIKFITNNLKKIIKQKDKLTESEKTESEKTESEKTELIEKYINYLTLSTEHFNSLIYDNYMNGNDALSTIKTSDKYFLNLHGVINNNIFKLPTNINIVFLSPISYISLCRPNYANKIANNIDEYLQDPYCFDKIEINSVFSEAIIYLGGQYCVNLELGRDESDNVTGLHLIRDKKLEDAIKYTNSTMRILLDELLNVLLKSVFIEPKKIYTIVISSCRESDHLKELDQQSILVFYEQLLKFLNKKLFFDNKNKKNNNINSYYENCNIKKSVNVFNSRNVEHAQQKRTNLTMKSIFQSRKHINTNSEYIKELRNIINNSTMSKSELFNTLKKKLKIRIKNHRNNRTNINNSHNELNNKIEYNKIQFDIIKLIFKDKYDLMFEFLVYIDFEYNIVNFDYFKDELSNINVTKINYKISLKARKFITDKLGITTLKTLDISKNNLGDEEV